MLGRTLVVKVGDLSLTVVTVECPAGRREQTALTESWAASREREGRRSYGRRRLLGRSRRESLTVELAVIPLRDPVYRFEDQLTNVKVLIQDNIVLPEVHDLEGDGPRKACVDCWRCEVDEQTTSCE